MYINSHTLSLYMYQQLYKVPLHGSIYIWYGYGVVYTSGYTVHLARYGVCRYASPPHEDTIIHLASCDGLAYTFVHLEFIHVPTHRQRSPSWLHIHMVWVRCIYTSGGKMSLARYGACRHASPPHEDTIIHLASCDGWAYNFAYLEFIHVSTTLQRVTASLDTPYPYNMYMEPRAGTL